MTISKRTLEEIRQRLLFWIGPRFLCDADEPAAVRAMLGMEIYKALREAADARDAEWRAALLPEGSPGLVEAFAVLTPAGAVNEFGRAVADAARQEEFERLYQKIISRISADTAGDFDAGLDQLEYNARQKEREAVRQRLATHNDAGMLTWLDARSQRRSQ